MELRGAEGLSPSAPDSGRAQPSAGLGVEHLPPTAGGALAVLDHQQADGGGVQDRALNGADVDSRRGLARVGARLSEDDHEGRADSEDCTDFPEGHRCAGDGEQRDGRGSRDDDQREDDDQGVHEPVGLGAGVLESLHVRPGSCQVVDDEASEHAAEQTEPEARVVGVAELEVGEETEQDCRHHRPPGADGWHREPPCGVHHGVVAEHIVCIF